MRLAIFSVLCLCLALANGCSSAKKDSGAQQVQSQFPQTIEDAVQSDFRTPENKKRDQYRHPVETLTFFGLTPEMTVVEITPGGGWYMEILAPYLATKGKYI